MACSKRHGPATAIKFLESATGRKLTQDDWHLIREDTAAAEGGLRRSRAGEGDAANAFMEFAISINADERVPTHEVESACVEFVNASNTEGTLAMIRRIARNGLPESVTSRKRRGDGKPRSKKVTSDGNVSSVNSCPACGQFSGDGHACPPEKLREYAVSEDTATAAAYDAQWELGRRHAMTLSHLHSLNGEKREYRGRGEGKYFTPDEVTIAELRELVNTAAKNGDYHYRTKNGSHSVDSAQKALANFDAEEIEMAALTEQLMEANERYEAFRWNRAFLVVTNGSGHVHSSMSCSTCFPTTRFDWRPEYSGSDEGQIVADAGERACTVCYPSAPVDVLSRPTRIFSDDERRRVEERDKRRIERDEKKKAQAAKAPTASGEPLSVVVGRRQSYRNPDVEIDEVETFKTERTATIWAVDQLVSETWRPLDSYKVEAVNAVVTSLAVKRGVPEDVVRKEIQDKANVKIEKNAKEAAQWAKDNQ